MNTPQTLCVRPDTPAKVGIIGSKEVGKTTLASLINGHLNSLGGNSDLVSEVARNCPFPLNERSTIGTAYWLLGAQITAEALVQETRQFAICDRTVLDLYPFTVCGAVQKEGSNPYTRPGFTRDIEALKAQILAYVTARPYDYLIYVPIRKEYQAIYSRPDNPEFQATIDKEFRRFLWDIQLSFVELRSVDSIDRLDEVMILLQKTYHFAHSHGRQTARGRT